MIRFKEDSYGYILLKAIALCGEFPYHSLYLIEGNDRIVKRTILNMKKQGYITVVGKGQGKTIRLTTKSFGPLKEIGEGYYDHYMFMTGNHKFRGGKNGDTLIWRNHRLAEILMMFQYVDAKIWLFDKPKLSMRKTKNLISNDEIYFYNSREIKNADIEQRYKTEFTRIMGALLSPGGKYAVYNTNKGLIKWNRQGEGKAQVLIEDIIFNNFSGRHEDLNNAIMFGKDMETALKILESNGGPRDSNDFEFLSFDNTYQNIYFIPLDGHGIYQLNLIIQRNWQDAIRYSIFPESYMDTDSLSVDCDGFDGDAQYILSFLDGNIGRLKRFKEASFDSKTKKYEVVCFDWQKDMVEKYMGSNVTIKEVTEEDLSKMINETFS